MTLNYFGIPAIILKFFRNNSISISDNNDNIFQKKQYLKQCFNQKNLKNIIENF